MSNINQPTFQVPAELEQLQQRLDELDAIITQFREKLDPVIHTITEGENPKNEAEQQEIAPLAAKIRARGLHVQRMITALNRIMGELQV